LINRRDVHRIRCHDLQKELGLPPPPSSAAVRKSMKANRGRDTGPEMRLRAALWKAGVRGYRVHWSGVPGRPDLAFPGKRIAVFVNGCYWHRCPRCNLPIPKTHLDFWKKKFELNVARDERKCRELRAIGWRVLVLWECETKKDMDRCVERIRRLLSAS